MNSDYKICSSCGAKVEPEANFCPECKSQSFKTRAVVVKKDSEPASFKHKLLYWNYDGEFVLSKSKLAAICVFLYFFLYGLTTNIAAGFFLFALVVAGLVFVICFGIHLIIGKPKEAVISFNDYGLVPDIVHLLFFWQNKNTGEFVPSKTKIISAIIFVVFCILGAMQNNAPTLLILILVVAIFEIPVFLVGFGIHKLTNPNPTNPKKIAPKKQPEKIPKKEKTMPKVEKVFERQVKEPEVIPKFQAYEQKVNELTDEFDKKQKVTRDLIEKRFEPPQITYTRFISIVDKAAEVFKNESESALNILHLASEDSPRIDRELDGKISIMESIIDRIEDLTNELVLSMDSSKDGDAEILIEDMENLISSVKDYDKKEE